MPDTPQSPRRTPQLDWPSYLAALLSIQRQESQDESAHLDCNRDRERLGATRIVKQKKIVQHVKKERDEDDESTRQLAVRVKEEPITSEEIGALPSLQNHDASIRRSTSEVERRVMEAPPRPAPRELPSATNATLVPMGGNPCGSPAVEVTGAMAVFLVDEVPVFRDLGAQLANLVCTLDVRLMGEARGLCVRSLSSRVSVNGKVSSDAWRLLLEGDVLGFGHRDSLAKDSQCSYAVTYLQDEVGRQHAVAYAFARDMLARYDVEPPEGAVEEAGLGKLLCPPADSSTEAEPWGARAAKASEELFAVSTVSRAIVIAARQRFQDWARDEATAHGILFGARTEEALEHVALSIEKCYEACTVLRPATLYWAEEGLKLCKENLRREEERAKEVDRVSAELRRRILKVAEAEEHSLEQVVVDRLERRFTKEFQEERQLDPDAPFEKVVERVWNDWGQYYARGYFPGTTEWLRFHLDIRNTITGLRKSSNFAAKLRTLLHDVVRHQGRHLAFSKSACRFESSCKAPAQLQHSLLASPSRTCSPSNKPRSHGVECRSCGDSACHGRGGGVGGFAPS